MDERGHERQEEDRERLGETAKIIVQALAIAMVVRVFFYQPFNIPSGSMKATLLVGDYLFVSKLSYGYSRYSFPFGVNLFSGRVLATARRSAATSPSSSCRATTRPITSSASSACRATRSRCATACSTSTARRCRSAASGTSSRARTTAVRVASPRYEETLPNGVKYTVLDGEQNGPFDNVGPYRVPPAIIS